LTVNWWSPDSTPPTAATPLNVGTASGSLSRRATPSTVVSCVRTPSFSGASPSGTASEMLATTVLAGAAAPITS